VASTVFALTNSFVRRIAICHLRGFRVTVGGQRHGAAAGTDCRRPRAVQPASVAPERVDKWFGLICAVQLRQCLHRVGQK